MKYGKYVSSLAAALLLGFAAPVSAETVKLAIGQRGNWDTSVAEIGQRAGIFKKHNLDLEMLYTQGGGETQQAVISGSVDVGVAAGTLGVLGAFSKGAPVRIIGAQATGAADFWYVPSGSKIQKIQDVTPDTTIAYSTNGSSTNSVVLGFMDQYKLKAKPVATGSPAATFTPVMSGQVDVGWSSPPFGFDALKEGKIRTIARANDVEAIRTQSIRTLISNARFVDSQKKKLSDFMAAYRESIDFMYSSDEAIKIYADFAGTDVATAKQIRDEFFPKSLIDPDKMFGLDQVMADAVTFKAISKPLDQEQLKTLIQIPPRS
jgi:NitT/TauT family transport system substrate-binding protein